MSSPRDPMAKYFSVPSTFQEVGGMAHWLLGFYHISLKGLEVIKFVSKKDFQEVDLLGMFWLDPSIGKQLSGCILVCVIMC
jgi:hypothetical protein